MVDLTPFLPGLSPVQGKTVVARFDGGRLSSEGGLLALREIERRLGLADRLSNCLVDPRAPGKGVPPLAEIIRFRMLMIAAGYEDGNDADALRRDPMFKLALDRLPAGEELCSQSTISRLENLPDRRALLRLGRALVEQYCGSFRAVPKRIVLDIDDTFDRVHGGQQLRLFNAHYDDYGFQPIVVFDAEGRFVTALLRPGKRPSGVEIRGFVRRLVGALRSHWPKVEILLRADSQYASPEVFDWFRENRVDWVFGLAPNAALCRHVAALEKSTAARFKGGARARQGAALRAIPRCRAELEPGRAHHRPRRGWARGHRYPVHRHQPGRRPRQAPLPAALLRAWSGRESHQGMEKPSRCRPHFLPRGRGQPVSSVPARRRLLALMVDAPRHAQTLGVARHAVRHLAAAPGQTRRPRRRTENPSQDPPADQRPRSGDLRHAARPPAASRHLRAGA